MASTPSPFGKNRMKDFFIDPKYVNINHGSFGLCPRSVMEVKREFEERMDFHPQSWFRVDSQHVIQQVREVTAKLVKAPASNIFLVENASVGFNAFVKSIKWQKDDVVVISNVAYIMAKKTIDYLQDTEGIKPFIIPFVAADFASSDLILERIRKTIEEAGPMTIRLAIFDHISSIPAIIFPVKQIISYFHSKQSPVFIDGAHACFQVHLDLQDLQADGYISNYHKWGFSPKSAAFLYLNDKYLQTTHPSVTGNFYGQGPAREFYWTGTRDYSTYCAIPAAIDYYNSFGENEVMRYNHELALEAGRKIATMWGTKPLTEDKSLIGFMENIEVPCKDFEKCNKLAYTMVKQVHCFPMFFQFDGKVYCRFSANIYNEMEDFVWAAKYIQEALVYPQPSL